MSTRKKLLFTAAWPFLFVGATVGVWAYGLWLLVFSRRVRKPILRGQTFTLPRSLALDVTTHWRAPFTDGFKQLLPAGTRLVAAEDVPVGARAVLCVPADERAFERSFVPVEVREDPKYAGCSISLRPAQAESFRDSGVEW